MTKTRVLEATGLKKSFGEIHAVRGVSFHIGAGETYGLLGPNGAGKTTSISMVSGLLQRDGGEVLLDGQSMTTTTLAPKQEIGLVPQDLAIYPDLTARENLRFFGHLYSMPKAELSKRIDEVLEVVGLSDRANDRSSEYSGGMKRRLNIGIGLLHRPKLLVLDEPTVGVDPQSRNAILESVEHLSSEGMAVLYTTHYMEEAERLCDRVGIIGQQDLIRITATGVNDATLADLRGLTGVDSVSPTDDSLDMLVSDAGAALPEAMRVLTAHGSGVSSVTDEEPDLEAVFLHLTGKALRD
jgi:ABC-2 type transport system ATP-binding protein